MASGPKHSLALESRRCGSIQTEGARGEARQPSRKSAPRADLAAAACYAGGVSQLQPGRVVAEHLRLVRLLGRGAMGSVWLTDHLKLQAQVAVKFMAPAMAADPASVARFKLEARAAAEIRSPHVVQVFDNGVTDDGELFIVMELLDGEGLDRRVKRQTMSLPELIDLVRQACKGLAKAHEVGIIHRDIKPANVFLLDTGGDTFIKLLDFGVAKFAEEEAVQLTVAGNMVGTPAYMSPEQLFDGGAIDHRGDLWSLAVVAYYALSGKRPFTGSSLGELCASIRRREFPLVSSLRDDIPKDLDDWFARAFHADPNQRFASAKAFAQALEMAADASSVMNSTPSAVVPVPALATFPGTTLPALPSTALPAAKRRWMPVAAAIAAAGLGVVAVAALISNGDATSTNGSDGVAPAAAGVQRPGDIGSASATNDVTDPPLPPASASIATVAPSVTTVATAAPSHSSLAKRPSRPHTTRPVTTTTAQPNPKSSDERANRAAEELGL